MEEEPLERPLSSRLGSLLTAMGSVDFSGGLRLQRALSPLTPPATVSQHQSNSAEVAGGTTQTATEAVAAAAVQAVTILEP